MAKYSRSEIPDPFVFPATTYGFEVVTATHSEEDKPLSIKVKFKITGPDSKKGLQYTETFRLGTDDDPQAENAATKRDGFTGMNWQRWVMLTKAVGIECETTEEEVDALNAELPSFVGDMNVREGKDKETKEPSGKLFNSIVRYYPVGRKEPKEPTEANARPTAKGGEKPAAAPAPAAPTAVSTASTSTTFLCELCDPPKKVNSKVKAAHMAKHEAEAEEEA